jgi:hypothetical protein
MKDIYEYINLSKSERQQHLKLDDDCIIRGGMSQYCKGLLAHTLETTIPAGYNILVCHACHNAKCSNPKHLYWGTPKENAEDRKHGGNYISIWDRMVLKYGEEGARELQKAKSVGNANGGGNKDKEKTVNHKEKISASVSRVWKERKTPL